MRYVAVVGRAHIVGILNQLLSGPKPTSTGLVNAAGARPARRRRARRPENRPPFAKQSKKGVFTDDVDVRRSVFDIMYGGVLGGTLNRKDGPFGYVEKNEAATEFFEMALHNKAASHFLFSLIIADAINKETLGTVARRLLDAFQAGFTPWGRRPFYTMGEASREVLELNASGAVSHSSSWWRRLFNLRSTLHIDHEVGLTSLAGVELDRLTEVLSRQRRLAATKEVTLTNIVPRFEESQCVELVPLELHEMDLSDVEQVSKWMY